MSPLDVAEPEPDVNVNAPPVAADDSPATTETEAPAGVALSPAEIVTAPAAADEPVATPLAMLIEPVLPYADVPLDNTTLPLRPDDVIATAVVMLMPPEVPVLAPDTKSIAPPVAEPVPPLK